MTQSELAALEEDEPLLAEPLPTVTDELLLPPPGDIVVEPLSPPGPVVTELEFDVVPEPPSCSVTTRQGLPLTMVVPSEFEVTETLSANAGTAMATNPKRTGRAALRSRIGILHKTP